MSISIQEALNTIKNSTTYVSTQIVPIENIKDKILAENIYASISLPSFNNSAMDGYAVKISDAAKEVKVLDSILAGSQKETTFMNGECIKIMTGARVPSCVEAIVPKELVTKTNNNTIILPQNLTTNQHIRFIGEDIQKDDLLLSIGTTLNFASTAILASQGISHVKVYRELKVSVFTSGEELRPHYEEIENYQLYNSNTPSFLARAKELGAKVTFVGIAKDTLSSLKEMISNSLDADFIITSGGVSVGDADFTKEAFESFGMEILIDGITIKPGKPTIFGKINNTYILNLPGNPLAASLIFEVFGRIVMQKLSGSTEIYHNTILSKMKNTLSHKPGRTTIIPGYFDGEYFTASEKRAAGMVGVLHKCNSMIVVDENTQNIEYNTLVKVLPINWNFFTNTEKNYLN